MSHSRQLEQATAHMECVMCSIKSYFLVEFLNNIIVKITIQKFDNVLMSLSSPNPRSNLFSFSARAHSHSPCPAPQICPLVSPRRSRSRSSPSPYSSVRRASVAPLAGVLITSRNTARTGGKIRSVRGPLCAAFNLLTSGVQCASTILSTSPRITQYYIPWTKTSPPSCPPFSCLVSPLFLVKRKT